ncbi:MAG: membrane protein insertase YidC [Acidobacteriia bacterium]|nr:membrane protein insertase YidC [Terriglobia bacterium]
MSEPNQTDQPRAGKPGKKELSMEQRMLLAFGLMGVVLLVSQFLLPKPPDPPVKKTGTAAVTQAKQAAPEQAPANLSEKLPSPRTASSQPASATQEETVEVVTDVYKVRFSNRGAVVHSWVLKKYQDSLGKPQELLNRRAIGKTGYPFATRLKNGESAQVLHQALHQMTVSPDKLRVEFVYGDAEWQARKIFQFKKDSYLTEVSSTLSQKGQPKQHLLSWRGGFGDETVIGAAASQHSVHFDLAETKLVVKDASAAKEGPIADRGNYSFAGIEDSYFAAVALPETTEGFEVHTLSDSIPSLDGKDELNAGIAVGGRDDNKFSLFVGPKDTDLLRSVSPRLEQLVDWGWLALLAKPLFLVLNWLHDNYIPNYGWSIVLLTIAINFLLLPLKITSLKSMKNMQVLQPQIAEINAKYKGLSMRDPKKANQNQEVMDLYKKHGVNPMGGCIPMVLQIPFFIAFYKVLSVAIEIRGADWLWVSDLSRPETLAIRVLPIAMIASQFIMQKMTPTAGGDPSQQKIMMLMPLFLGFMFYGVSSGLVLYWLTGNVVGIGQQWFFNRTFHASPAIKEPVKRKPK